MAAVMARPLQAAAAIVAITFKVFASCHLQLLLHYERSHIPLRCACLHLGLWQIWSVGAEAIECALRSLEFDGCAMHVCATFT